MKNVENIENINLRHLARMSNALEHYASNSLSLSDLVAELVFLRDSIAPIAEDDCIELNDALMDLESIASTVIEAEHVDGLRDLEKKSIEICESWIKKIEEKFN